MFGWLPDPVDSRDHSATQVIQSAGRAGGKPSLLHLRKGKLEQGGTSSCVGHAVARGIHVSILGQLPEGKTVELPSAYFPYYNGRVAERIGMTPADRSAVKALEAPVVDEGSHARLVMKSTQALGYTPYSLWPNNPLRVNRRPSPRCYSRAFDQKGFRYARIYETGAARVDALIMALAAGWPVVFAMDVDEAFKDHVGTAPISTIGQRVGGHMLAALAFDGEAVVFDNWWGPRWGSGGLGRMTPALFGTVARDIYAIQAASPYSGGG